MYRFTFLWFLICLLTTVPVHAKDAVSLTIYSKAVPGSIPPEAYRPVPGGTEFYGNVAEIPGYAVIRQQRNMELGNKRGKVNFSDVAAYIDPTTVTFTSLSDPQGTHVIEQNYLFDLVNKTALQERYLGKRIVVEQLVGDSIEEVEGTLLSNAEGLVVQKNDGSVITFTTYSGLRFPSLPEGLITKPTLMWDVSTAKPGNHEVEVSYQTSGLTWWADYNLTFSEGKDANSGTGTLDAWVSIINQSGATYPEAKLKLMAGDVQRVTPPTAMPMYRMAEAASSVAADMSKGFEEKPFFEYHLYTLGRSTTLPDNSTKQIELFPAVQNILLEKELVYTGADKVEVYLKFKNEAKRGLGIPLPAGRIRVNKRDTADNTLEFIGEDIIDHTPKDEDVEIKVGNSFDVTGKREIKAQRQDQARRFAEEDREIILRNHKTQPVKVIVRENVGYGANWKILNPTHAYEKKNAYTIEFPIDLPKDGEVKLQYTVHSSW